MTRNAGTPEHFIADDGMRIPLHIAGSGPALVILHGWTGRWQDWQTILKRLQERFTCYVWEARPYQAAATNATLERMARDVQNLLDAFELERPVLMGHSMGGLTSWEYIRQFGDQRLSRLCIIDQSPRLLTSADWNLGLYGRYTEEDNEAFIADLRRNFADTAIDKLIKRSRDGITDNPAVAAMLEARRQAFRTFAAEPWIVAWQSLSTNDYRDVLPAISVPTLLIYGDASRFYGTRVAEYVHANISDSVLKLYPNAGHSPQFENPETFVNHFIEFAS
ncbi:pimeloyl-ACP methyl ester carboxylesterase [Paucimonas lemoignei]|uniref:Pimeloyl-ACP methyl ester carboxylesterase n=1 Tax=Paucimonas lemoignei TaxID=29443 RepID=A0A4V2UJA8_PAULE|nr:alpha/beta hydrolase [Paucimonas lemoignei]TCS39360.1 pimeloyl-ACP methyl ester carboxylesterase [Paucimonas lemoignei]